MKALFASALTLVVLFGFAISQSTGEEGEAAGADVQPLQPHEVRNAVRLVLQREATAEGPDQRAAAIRDLSKMYVALARDEEMAVAARKRLKAKMYTRLISIQDDLKANISRHERDVDGDWTQYPTQESLAEEAQTTRGGGAVRDYGETLVELIQATISPEHWDVNGGPGSIVYYPNLKVLVVRASGDAHGHVGGLFGGLRRVP